MARSLGEDREEFKESMVRGSKFYVLGFRLAFRLETVPLTQPHRRSNAELQPLSLELELGARPA
jgi:hypothetical protein